MTGSHLFAIYSLHPLPAQLKAEDVLELRDAELWNRITRILRLIEEEKVILFDHNIQVTIKILPATFQRKGWLVGTVIDVTLHQPLKPEVHLYPCLLKKDAFEEVVYVAAQMGVTTITPVVSDKIQRRWGGEHEFERLKKIMIAACEQSKNFVLPQINQPQKFDDVQKQWQEIKKETAVNIAFYEGGKPLKNLMPLLTDHKIQSINLIFGPEGGFAEAELDLLTSNQVYFSALTPTILRAKEAITVGVGIVRSITS